MRSPFDLGAKQMKDISLRILDMECAACVARLDRALEKLPGVQRAAVNYTAASALITYDERVTDLAAIAARVKRAGFRVPVEEQDLLPAEADAETAAAAADALRAVFGVKGVAVQADGTLTAYLWPIGVDGRDLAAACAVAGCAVTPGELRGGDADQELEKRMDLLKTLVTSACCTAPLMLEMHPKLQFLAGTALQFGPGRYFYKSAWRGLRNRTFGMDFLVSLSSTLIYLYSAYVTFTPRRSYKLYFASDGVLLSLILFGKYMEQVAAGEANSAIRKLMHLQPRTAMVQRGDTFVELPVDQIAEHDLVRIRPGERVPVDGTVVSGQCAVDESMLTGESMPVDKAPGDKVIGGSLNRSGSAIVSAEALGKASVLEQIIQIVRQAQCEKAPVQRFADKVAHWFVPGVIGAAALTFLIWYRRIAPRNLERALLTCCDVLSVACPCALGLATPTGLMVGSGRAAEHGILFKSGAELENAYKADCVVFDKTGTLTNGAPALTDVCPCSGVRPEPLVRLAAALEQCSDHPLARAVTAYAQQQSDAPLPPVEDFSYALGRGVRGTVAGAAVVCGSRTWLRELGIDTAALAALPDLRAQAKTELCVARGGVVLGTLGIADTRKSEAAAVVAQLRAAGKEVWMMTGDHARTAEAIAAEVGIGHVLSEVRPDEKAAAIERLRAQGKTVCMVGDGINDTPALAVADCAVAMGGGSDIAIESAGILLPSGNLEKLPELFDISRATIRTIRQNLTWALFYNLVSIPVAALGVLHPSICATAMSASSIGVLMHSLRLKDSGKKERRFPWKKKS